MDALNAEQIACLRLCSVHPDGMTHFGYGELHHSLVQRGLMNRSGHGLCEYRLAEAGRSALAELDKEEN